MTPAPLTFSEPQARRVWLSDRPKCDVCGYEVARMYAPAGVFVILKCQRPAHDFRVVGRRCNSNWWCMGLHPGTLGFTMERLFGTVSARVFMAKLFPQTIGTDEDLWHGYEVAPLDGEVRYLQVGVSETEAKQRPSPTVTQRILALLKPISRKAAAL